MLELKNIHKVFNPGTINEKRAIQNLSFTLNDGDFVTVIGGNGAGKSTMLNLIAGVYTADAGSIVLDGADITKLPEYKRAKLLGRVFQDPMMGTAGNMGIEENLAMAYRRGRTRTLRWGISNEEREFYKEKLQMLDLGLEGRLTSKVRLLSGGTASGADAADGNAAEPQVAAAGRAHRRAGSKNRAQGAYAHGKDHFRE